LSSLSNRRRRNNGSLNKNIQASIFYLSTLPVVWCQNLKQHPQHRAHDVTEKHNIELVFPAVLENYYSLSHLQMGFFKNIFTKNATVMLGIYLVRDKFK